MKGRCFLDELILIPEDVPIDAMHQVFLGCAKSVILALVGSLSKRNLREVEKRLCYIKSPRNRHGKSKPLSEISYWKARDFKFFLFYYGGFCLREFVREDLLISFEKLALSMRLLSLQNIDPAHIDEAEKFLCDFLSNFVQLYGTDSQTFNFHSLRHLCKFVEKVPSGGIQRLFSNPPITFS